MQCVGVRSEQSGMAMILSLLLVVIAMGIVTAGTTTFMAHRKEIETDYARYAQANQLARSGLTEAVGWFVKQSSQPVMDFEPVLNASASPPILDTDDPDIGIVRDFQIAGQVWGRYEVWKDWDADPDASRLAWRKQVEVEDISAAVGLSAGGSWRVLSTGYIYRKRDESAAFNVAPNYVVAVQSLQADIRRLTLSPPGQAAINVDRGSAVTVNTNGRVYGGATGAGIYYPSGTGTPNDGPASENRVTGNPALSPTGSYDDSLEAVFGVSRSQLLAMADDIITDMSSFPVPVPAHSILVVDNPSVQFDATTPLNSTAAIVYIEGNVVINDSKSVFSGLLYVDGNLTLRDPCEIKGSIVCTGNITIQGMPDFADVYFDDDVLNELRLNIGNYRLASAIKPTEDR